MEGKTRAERENFRDFLKKTALFFFCETGLQRLDRRPFSLAMARNLGTGISQGPTFFNQSRHAHAAHHQEKCHDIVVAEKRYRDMLDDCSHTLGFEHPDTIEAINRLSLLLFRGRKLIEAEPLYRRALLANTRRLGEDHPETLAAVNNLAVLCKKMNKFTEAETLYRRALAGQERRLGPQHADTLDSVSNLAVLVSLRGTTLLTVAQPLPLLRPCLVIYVKIPAKKAEQNERGGTILSSGNAGARLATGW